VIFRFGKESIKKKFGFVLYSGGGIFFSPFIEFLYRMASFSVVCIISSIKRVPETKIESLHYNLNNLEQSVVNLTSSFGQTQNSFIMLNLVD